MLVKRITVFEG